MPSVSKFSIKNQTKSISLPCRSHPTTYEIEELLNKIKTEATSPTMYSGLSHLTRLYKCMNNLLTSSTTQVLMSHEQKKKWVDELVDESVKFLDICRSISDMILEFKDHSRDLYSCLRRKKGDMISVSIMKYNCFRKKMKKDVRGLISSLKQVDNMITSGDGGLVVIDSDNHQLAAMIRAVIGVGEVTILVLESLLMFFCVPVSKPNKWSLVVSKLTHKGMVTYEDQHEHRMLVNECEQFDDALRILCKNGSTCEVGNVEIAQCRLERLEAEIETMESGLESLFRHLVQTRVSLLNIISQ
uniref:uncharacterized protein LOC122604627 n=1 Tax=Erigeron canadensis TaxID=72917 RepID=UPI001CB97F34|nr:uncharacterized protein LOC122604627 [Erigeron canadensis]